MELNAIGLMPDKRETVFTELIPVTGEIVFQVFPLSVLIRKPKFPPVGGYPLEYIIPSLFGLITKPVISDLSSPYITKHLT